MQMVYFHCRPCRLTTQLGLHKSQSSDWLMKEVTEHGKSAVNIIPYFRLFVTELSITYVSDSPTAGGRPPVSTSSHLPRKLISNDHHSTKPNGLINSRSARDRRRPSIQQRHSSPRLLMMMMMMPSFALSSSARVERLIFFVASSRGAGARRSALSRSANPFTERIRRRTCEEFRLRLLN